MRCTELGYSDGRGKTNFRFLIFSLFTSQFSNLKLPNHCDQAIASSNHSLFAVVSHFETQSAAFLHLSLELSEKWRAGTYLPALHSVEFIPELFRVFRESPYGTSQIKRQRSATRSKNVARFVSACTGYAPTERFPIQLPEVVCFDRLYRPVQRR